MKRFVVMIFAAAMLFTAVAAWAQDAGPSQTMEAKPDAMAKYKENLPASRFVLIAYGVVWTGLFIYLVTLHRRQGALEQRLAELEPIFEALDEDAGKRKHALIGNADSDSDA
jgi:CcmD family protein